MRQFYSNFDIREGDEVVVQKLGENAYRLLPEPVFQKAVTCLERRLDSSPNEATADAALQRLSNLTNTPKRETLLGEYCRLASLERRKRRVIISQPRGIREFAPPSVRRLLAEIYDGKCQVTGFGFMMKTGRPYFEVHHIRPDLGNHIKNLLLVCPNTHAQFTYAKVDHFFDEGGWLRRVRFNGQPFDIYHAIDAAKLSHYKEVHSEA
jgi:hypothetical protein